MNDRFKSGTAPSPSKLREPNQTRNIVKSHYTTGGIVGGAAVSKRAPVGWEAITPKPTSKPEPVIAAKRAMDQAWAVYLKLIDTLEAIGKWDEGSVEAAWTEYEQAEAAYYEAAEAAEADYRNLYSPEAHLSEVRP